MRTISALLPSSALSGSGTPVGEKQWQYVAEESGETGAALLRIWRGNMVLVIVSLAVMAVLVWMG